MLEYWDDGEIASENLDLLCSNTINIKIKSKLVYSGDLFAVIVFISTVFFL